jgi:2-polyprenyl-6-methoxyphenol hydroxylase-like FAD-dependent oxidoreductase
VRVAIVGAGLAGLASAAALSRAGHQVRVFERSETLRASGLQLNFWSNATSLLPAFGVAMDLGEPVHRMMIRRKVVMSPSCSCRRKDYLTSTLIARLCLRHSLAFYRLVLCRTA